MKKLCYEVEEKNTVVYIVFSCFCVFCSIISIIVGMFTGAENKSMFASIVGIILFALFIYIILFINDKKKDKIRKELNNIKNNGIKVEGTLIKFNRYTTRFRRVDSGNEYSTHYTVTVEYINPYTNEKLQYETPELSFDAHHSLGSKKCSVYILDDKIYVTDFVKLNKGEENIWAQEDDYYKEIANLEKKEMKKIVVGIVLFILLWLGIVIFGFFWY